MRTVTSSRGTMRRSFPCRLKGNVNSVRNDALSLLEQLSSKYPNNYLLKLEIASTLVTLRRSEEAFALHTNRLADAGSPTSFSCSGFCQQENAGRENIRRRLAPITAPATRYAPARAWDGRL